MMARSYPPASFVVSVLLVHVVILCGIIHPIDSLSLVPRMPIILFNNNNNNNKAQADVASADATTTTSSGEHRRAPFGFRYTHLEGNGQLWQITDHHPASVDYDDDDPTKKNDGYDNARGRSASSSLSVVVDPLASQLDFGIPWGYRANKKIMSEDETIDAICDADPRYCLLTMGLDDHTHLPTLRRLRDRMPDMKYVIAPSCVGKLTEMGIRPECMTVLDHGKSFDLLSNDDRGDGGVGAIVTATRGALVGPPWQRRENGYLLEFFRNDDDDGDGDDDGGGVDGGTGDRRHGRKKSVSIYYEPHGDVVLDDIRDMRANVVISPVTEQSLPAQIPPPGRFTLVYGGERTLHIAETLRASVIVPLGNGALDIDGPLSGLVISSGDVDDFEDIVTRRNDDANKGGGGEGADDDIIMKVARAIPGVPLTIMI